MDPNSYTNADTNVPKIGQYWDPEGDYEYHDTIYALLVYTPARQLPRYMPSFLTRKSDQHTDQPDSLQSQSSTHDSFKTNDLTDMKTKTIKIKSWRFPPEMRCKHVYEGKEKVCKEGCYVLEKSGGVGGWFCKREGKEGCEGHVFVGEVKRDEKGVACFGKTGERMVCLER